MISPTYSQRSQQTIICININVLMYRRREEREKKEGGKEKVRERNTWTIANMGKRYIGFFYIIIATFCKLEIIPKQ